MKETIYTIPITLAFEEKSGCPVCRLKRDLIQSSLDYATGAAMMEPDVREQMNQQGFAVITMMTCLACKRALPSL